MDTYTRRQEIVNGLTAAIGMLFGISGLPVLVGWPPPTVIHQVLSDLVFMASVFYCCSPVQQFIILHRSPE